MLCRPLVARLLLACCAASIPLSAENGRPDSVPICLGGDVSSTNQLMIGQAELIAARVFQQIRIRLQWHNFPSACPEEQEPIRVRVWAHTPPDYHRGASGTPWPYGGIHAEIFLDRMQDSFEGSILTALVGHVLAHEIAHVLGGTDGHSTGVMQPSFSPEDLRKMTLAPLRFSESFIIVLQDGIRTRHERLTEIKDRGLINNQTAEVSLARNDGY